VSGSQPIVFTRREIEALHAFMQAQPSKVRTYRVQRDTRNVLLVVEPNGKLERLSP
jgi:hypothetical protein